MFQVYQPSWRVGFASWPLLLLAIIAAIGAAFGYQIALEFIPLIYINFLVTYGIGHGLGWLNRQVIVRGKCRNVAAAALFGVVLASSLLGAKFFFQYQRMLSEFTQVVLDENQLPDSERGKIRRTISQELTFVKHLELRVQEGWNIQRRGNNMPIAGVMVYVVWIVEAGILLWFPLTRGIRAAQQPFNESRNEWASESQVAMVLPITGDEMVSRIQTAQEVKDLLEIPIPQSDESNRFAVYTVNSIPGQELEDAYLTVHDVSVSTNAKGEPVRNETLLVKHAILSSAQRSQLLDNASLLQEALTEYRKAMNEEILAENLKKTADSGGNPHPGSPASG